MNGDCSMVSPGLYTKTDCNGLHFRGLGGQTLPTRADHLFLRAPQGTVGVAGTGLAYVAPEEIRGRSHELSDQYGVHAELRIQKKR